MRAVLIPAEGDPRDVELPDSDRLDTLRELVGGPIEGLSVGRDDATAFGNDEAKLLSREVPCEACDGAGVAEPGAGLSDPCPTCEGRCTTSVEGLAPNPVASALIYGEQEAARERGEAAMDEYRAMGFEVITSPMHDDPREPYIAGDVVVTGFEPLTGNTAAIPDDLAASILGDRS